jgi:Ca2+-binding EF-hand superfamily protein
VPVLQDRECPPWVSNNQKWSNTILSTFLLKVSHKLDKLDKLVASSKVSGSLRVEWFGFSRALGSSAIREQQPDLIMQRRSGVTSQKHKNLEAIFNIFDVTRDGFVTAEDFRRHADRTCAALQLAEGTPDWHVIRKALRSWWDALQRRAVAPNGRISTPDCVAIMANGLVDDSQFFESAIAPIARTVFKVLDADGNNKINESEYINIYIASGLTAEIAINAFGRIDTNSDGMIELDEFVDVIREAFTTADPDSPGAWFFGVSANA